jgi:hypothetical protein
MPPCGVSASLTSATGGSIVIRATTTTNYPAPGGAGKNPFDQIREAAVQKRKKVPTEPVGDLALGAKEDARLHRQGEQKRSR